MFGTIRSLVLGALTVLPIAAEAIQPCDVISQIVEIDAQIGRDGVRRELLLQRIAALPANSDWVDQAMSAQWGGLALPDRQRDHLLGTLDRWQQWRAAGKIGSRAEQPADARLTGAVRRSMLHILLACGQSNHRQSYVEIPLWGIVNSEVGDELRRSHAGHAVPVLEQTKGISIDPEIGKMRFGLAYSTLLGCLGLVAAGILMEARKEKRYQAMRGSRRYRLRAPIKFSLDDTQPIHGTILDVSRTGCLITISSALAVLPGTPCTFWRGACRITGRTMWSKRRQVGIAFDHPLSNADVARLLSEQRSVHFLNGSAKASPAE